jgi:methylenetetrahydrofolate reductase (NADPH)
METGLLRGGTVTPRPMAQRIADMVSLGSIEMAARDAASALDAAELLPAGMSVYVNFLPGQSLSASLEAAIRLRWAGFNPVPHIAARQIESLQSLRWFVQHAVRDAGVRRVMLIGGDAAAPLGPYSDSVALMRTGVLADAGLSEVGIAGYPEGHTRIDAHALEAALGAKLALADAQGLRAHVVTQFSFAPTRVLEYCAALAHRFPGVPVYAGVAGPTSPAALLKYAQRCGVSASLRALGDLGMGAIRLVTHTDPAEQVTALAGYFEHRANCNVAGVHLYSFGGFLRAARWVNGVIAEGASQDHFRPR